jgi:putative NIF3 family GTP cyclohydrolase 1 type 2
LKISEVILKLTKFHPPVNEQHTCDTVKCGNPNQECTGIVVTAFASVEVIREAIAKKANLIIVHEPVFYSHADQTDWLLDNTVYQEKQKLLDEGQIVVWRDHDRMHGAGKPGGIPEHDDLIFQGIMDTLGWRDYSVGNARKPLSYVIPETTVGELAKEICSKLGLNGARLIGDPQQKVTKVFLCEHINGANFGGHDKDSEAIADIEKSGYEVLIPFEIIDWTLSCYVRDAIAEGKAKALIEVGHFNMEEAGMKYMEKWLPDVIGSEVPVYYVQSGDAFSYMTF